jgi:phosphomannomutase
MVPVGHAFAKPILRETGAVCGGELAGHYYFREFFGCDSGVLAALRILQCVAKAASEGRCASEMVAEVNSRYANSGELNFRVDDKDAAIARALDAASRGLPPELSRTGIDGVRVEYAEGWINIRKSNTEPYLRLIAEADTKERLGAWISVLTRAVEERRGT